MDKPLVSIIMPAYNAEKYIAEAIESVLAQSHKNWELLIINDGSKDNTVSIIKSFTDTRIKFFSKENGGVSSARNIGLKNMQGDYFCFLDADDVFPIRSISSRLEVFDKDPQISYVDGKIEFKNNTLSIVEKIRASTYQGNTLSGLCQLDSNCFFGNTWMVKQVKKEIVPFKEGLTHGEDLLFYLHNCSTGYLSYTDELILQYRQSIGSAMTNLKGLENGYRIICQEINKMSHVSNELKTLFRNKTRSIMFKSYLGNLQPLNALKVLFTW